MTIHPARGRQERASSYHGRRMTEAEYLRLPEVKPYLEYVDGVVLQKPMPNDDHAIIAAELAIRLGMYRATYKGRVGVEGRVRLTGPNFRVPDVSFWASGRRGGDDSVPSLAIEVRSPGQTLNELRAKCRAYRESGVESCWIIDVLGRAAEILEDGADRMVSPEGTLEATAVPGFALPLADLFAVLEQD